MSTPIAETEGGRIAGSVSGEIITFRGIPYVAPPIGALRWCPPQPMAPWTGVRDAVAFGADFMQAPIAGDETPLRTAPSEDGLFLNVWQPANAAPQPLPVIVWIHGGGFVNGGSSLAIYDGARFATHGIVFVSINYRLGRFGFFAHPALTHASPDGPLGNYGFLDQIAALQWVQRNIAAFGGDPTRVTIFGHSAGGESIHLLLTSPLARGLFARAMIASGGGRTGFTPTRTFAQAEVTGASFARAAGIVGSDAAALRALRALPAERIVDGLTIARLFAGSVPTYSGPMVDGTIAPTAPEAAYASGAFARVPLLVGATSADGMPPPATMDAVLAQLPAEPERVRTTFDAAHTGDVRAVGARLAAVSVGEPARYVARAFRAAHAPVYLYRFAYVATAQRAAAALGAAHGSELPFVFDTLAARFGAAATAADERVAQRTNAAWANFAKTGDPNGAQLPHWPAYTVANDVLLDIAADGAAVAGPDPWKAQLDLFADCAESQPTS